MIFLYEFIESNRTRIAASLVNQIPRQVRAYTRMPRAELRQSVERLLDAYLSLVASGSTDALKFSFDYLTKARVSQGFKLSDLQRALLLFIPITRQMLRAHCRDFGKEDSILHQAESLLESTAFQSVALLADVYGELMQTRVDEHNHYLQEQNRNLGIDLSNLILFRA